MKLLVRHQHRHRHGTQDTARHATEHELAQARMAVAAHDDEIHAGISGCESSASATGLTDILYQRD